MKVLYVHPARNKAVFLKSSSDTGFQFSLGGRLGLMVGFEEEVHLNILRLIFDIDPLGPAIKLPRVRGVGGA